jgi:hypothetical protein
MVCNACPLCTEGTLCVDGACRTICDEPQDACKAVSNCPADHACLATVQNGSVPGPHVCMPAAPVGAPCGEDVFCAVSTVCGAVNDGPYQCLPTCTDLSAACGSQGGICLQSTTGCAFCSNP